jgi:uncharacterized membrane protein YkoI
VKKVRHALRVAAAFGAGASVAAVALGAAALPVHAQSYPDTGSAFAPDDPPAAFIAQRGRLSLSQATAIAQSRFQGRVVRAEAVQQGNRVIYEIRILGNDGRVRTVRVDSETGAVM